MSQSGHEGAGGLDVLANVAGVMSKDAAQKRAMVMCDSDGNSGGEGGAAKARKVGAGGAAKARKVSAGGTAKVRDVSKLPACSRRTGELLKWTKAELRPFAEAPGDDQGKVCMPRFDYVDVKKEDCATAAVHDVVRRAVGTTWANGRGTTGDAGDKHMEHIALALAGAIFAAVQNQQQLETVNVRLTQEEIVRAVVRCVPSKEDMLKHFEALGAPPGFVQLGMWYGAQSYAALMQSLVELGLATGTKQRAEGLVIKYEHYIFCAEAFWLDLLPRLYGDASKERTNMKSCKLFGSVNMFYEARGVAGFGPIRSNQNPKEARPEGVTEAAHAKMCSLRAVEWFLKHDSEWKNKWRFTHNRMQPHETVAYVPPGQVSQQQVDELTGQVAALKDALQDALNVAGSAMGVAQNLAQELAMLQ